MRRLGRALTGVASAALGGCFTTAEDVPIRGAPPEVEARIRDALVTIADELRGGREVPLTAVRWVEGLETDRSDIGGRFEVGIMLLDDTLGLAVERTVRHEFCHAWDAAHLYTVRPERAWPDTAREDHVYDLPRDTQARVRMEAFAEACALQARDAARFAAAAAACGHPSFTDVGRALWEDVRADVPAAVGEARGELLASLDLPRHAEGFEVAITEEGVEVTPRWLGGESDVARRQVVPLAVDPTWSVVAIEHFQGVVARPGSAQGGARVGRWTVRLHSFYPLRLVAVTLQDDAGEVVLDRCSTSSLAVLAGPDGAVRVVGEREGSLEIVEYR